MAARCWLVRLRMGEHVVSTAHALYHGSSINTQPMDSHGRLLYEGEHLTEIACKAQEL